MNNFKSIEIVPKMEVNAKTLELIYTPGVGISCKQIAQNVENSWILTNRSNSVGVISDNWQKSLSRSMFLKNTLQIDAYPLVINNLSELKFVVENLEPNFKAFDLSLIENSCKINFDVEIPVLTNQKTNLQEFFGTISRTLFMKSTDNFSGSIEEQSLQLRDFAGGVIETQLCEEERKKPVAIFTDGSAVLGLGNLGAYAALPVMEGKSTLFKTIGDIDAIPICVKTQDTNEIIKLATLLCDSFSGINLEDICAPKCFTIEQHLIETLNIPVFHDDQHGAAIVILAALLNSCHLVNKKLEDIKIAVSGAGAAAQATVRLLLKAGVKNIIMSDIDGIVYQNRPNNDKSLNEIAKVTNLENMKGTLKDSIKNADVFIGLSAPNLVDAQMIKSMKKNPIVFALANPVPEIMPNIALKAGAYIVGTGRSDFDNQINNSLCFPGLFRGLLKNNILKITDEMKIECAFAIASCVSDEDLKPDCVIPNALDGRISDKICEVLKNFA